MPAPLDNSAKIIGKVTLGPGGCLLWTGCLATTGYGRVSYGSPRRTEYAHRVAYEIAYGPIEPAMVIDHLCGVRRCVNPAHLEVVTRYENNHRGGIGTTAWCGRWGHGEGKCGPRCAAPSPAASGAHAAKYAA